MSIRHFLPALALVLTAGAAAQVDTGQVRCYDQSRPIACPEPGEPFYGQDAQYRSAPMRYRDNGDGTVTDLTTGLMWSQAVDPRKLRLAEAKRVAAGMTLGGHHDWRVPNIKELYSLIDFRGYTGFSPPAPPGTSGQSAFPGAGGAPGQRGRGNPGMSHVPANAVPFIDTDVFDFAYGDVTAGERYIDAQWLSSTRYVSTTMDGAETLFGVNFADGRIKGYGYLHPNRPGGFEKRFYVRYVRGAPYGRNQFQDNGDGTVTDHSTGLTWMQADSGRGMTWREALAHAESMDFAGHGDWRLPNAKELQYLVDYSRSPDTSKSAAIDPIFHSSAITNEAGERDYPFYWTSTTHLDGPRPGSSAVYISFGRAIGRMHDRVMDVHGAGAQRSDPKTGSARLGHGPQGDARRVRNYVRLVRGGDVQPGTRGWPNEDKSKYPFKIRIDTPVAEASAPLPMLMAPATSANENRRFPARPRRRLAPNPARAGYADR